MEEFFKELSEASAEKERYYRKIELEKEIEEMYEECGSCNNWMTKQCKREVESHKVRGSELICDSFNIKSTSEWVITEKKKELEALK